MMFADEMRSQKRAPKVQIFATDIDEQMLRIAREASMRKAVHLTEHWLETAVKESAGAPA